MKFPKSCKVIMYFNRFFEITQFQNESQKSFLWLNFLMSHKRLVFTWQKNFQEVIHPQIFFVIYLYQDASAKRIFKQKNSLADLIHSPISKSDHSAPSLLSTWFLNAPIWKSYICIKLHTHNILMSIFWCTVLCGIFISSCCLQKREKTSLIW